MYGLWASAVRVKDLGLHTLASTLVSSMAERWSIDSKD
jgi:hypothetical protein